MNTSRQLFQLARTVARRQISTSGVKRVAANEVHPGYKKIKELQKQFLQDDGLPIHLKRGAVDRILYRFTMGLTIVALLMDMNLFYELAFPPKKQ